MLEGPCARVVLMNGGAIWNYSSSDNSPCDGATSTVLGSWASCYYDE
jgi:hypothetical protein